MGSDKECGRCQTLGTSLAVISRPPLAAYSFSAAGSNFDCDAKRWQPARKVQEMLFRQNFRWGHEGNIVIALQNHQCGAGGHHGFAGTNIALEQPAHWVLAAEILADLSQHARLR